MTVPKADALPLAILLSRIAGAVGAVRKDDRNTTQNYAFRGIDAVVNATHPHLVAHGVTVRPVAVDVTYETIEVGAKRTPMTSARVIVTYRFLGPAGDELDVMVPGEAFDSGDKAVPKAMSVAFRTALLQTLTLPTDEPDPDTQGYERSDATALTPTQEASVNEFAEAIRTADVDEHLRGLWSDVKASHLPEHAKAGLIALVNDRKRTLDAAPAAPDTATT